MRKSLKNKQNLRPSLRGDSRMSSKSICQTVGAMKTSSKIDQSGRMSMLPLKRQSFQLSRTPLAESHSVQLSQTVGNSSRKSTLHTVKSMKKQAIWSNLVNKLDHEQEIRQIIASKLQKSQSFNRPSLAANSCCFTSEFEPFECQQRGFQDGSSCSRAKDRQSYCLNSTLQKNNDCVRLQLQKCQKELGVFKELVLELSEKLVKLEKSGKQDPTQEAKANKTKQNTSTQTEFDLQQSQRDEDGDFIENLEKTLSVLNRHKGLL